LAKSSKARSPLLFLVLFTSSYEWSPIWLQNKNSFEKTLMHRERERERDERCIDYKEDLGSSTWKLSWGAY